MEKEKWGSSSIGSIRTGVLVSIKASRRRDRALQGADGARRFVITYSVIDIVCKKSILKAFLSQLLYGIPSPDVVLEVYDPRFIGVHLQLSLVEIKAAKHGKAGLLKRIHSTRSY
jgi:hypothetical protein